VSAGPKFDAIVRKTAAVAATYARIVADAIARIRDAED
jgi:hypothetical protein